jgi:beta-1,4-mannosyltransferase
VIRQNPYQRLLYEHLRPFDVELVEGAELKLGWLLRYRRSVEFLHFHWPHGYYEWPVGDTRLRRTLSWARLAVFATRLAAARLLGYRVWWTIHQVHPHESLSSALDRSAGRVLAGASDLLTAHDRATAEQAHRELGVELPRIAVVPHGSYIGVYQPTRNAGQARHAVRQDLELPDDAFVFLAFGHLREYKEVDVLFDAFSRVRDSRGWLVVAGLPHERNAAAAAEAAAARNPRIRLLLEFVPDDAVADLFAAADAAVVARGDGGSSGALVLSLSLATPAVAAAVPNVEELLRGEEAGWLFAAGDVTSLTAALERALEEPTIDAKARAAKSIADELAWDQIAARYAELVRAARAPRRISIPTRLRRRTAA